MRSPSYLQSGRKPNPYAFSTPSSLRLLLFLSPLVLLTFFLGLFVGSRISGPGGGNLRGPGGVDYPAVYAVSTYDHGQPGVDRMTSPPQPPPSPLSPTPPPPPPPPLAAPAYVPPTQLPPPSVATVVPPPVLRSSHGASASLPPPPTSFLQATSSSPTGSLILPTPPSLTVPSSPFTVSLHVSFHSPPPSGIRTLLTTKSGGCAPSASQNGHSLYLNSWDTSDHLLVFEYGSSSSGCNKITSAVPFPLHSAAWFHVAITYDPSLSFVSMYLNGASVHTATVHERPAPQIEHRELHIGVNRDGEDRTEGRIAGLVMSSFALSSTEVQALYSLGASSPSLQSVRGLDLALPLDDEPKAEGSPPRSLGGASASGAYNFPKASAFSSFTPGGGGRFSEYMDGSLGSPVTPEMRADSDALARTRRIDIKGSMEFVWAAYKKYAFGMDELKPISLRGHNPWGGMGTTLVDSLDTLWLMGMKDEFYEGRDWVRDKLSHDHVGQVSVFETTIRSLGGLLSAYDLSGDMAFLDKATDLGSRLVKAFDSPTGLPYGQTVLNGGRSMNAGWTGGSSLLAEIGTLQVREERNETKGRQERPVLCWDFPPVYMSSLHSSSLRLLYCAVFLAGGAFTCCSPFLLTHFTSLSLSSLLLLLFRLSVIFVLFSVTRSNSTTYPQSQAIPRIEKRVCRCSR